MTNTIEAKARRHLRICLKRQHDADEIFSALLLQRYGRNAGDSRYRYRHDDLELDAAKTAYQHASKQAHEAWEAVRAAKG